MIISINPNHPSSLKFTAQGYIKMTSISNSTNNIAMIKYLIEKGMRELPTESIPHSKVSNLISDFRLGPNMWVKKMVVMTKPIATTNMMAIGK